MTPNFRHIATILAVTSLVVLAALAAERSSARQVTVTYLANEGVMIDCGGQKALIDALFRDSLENYMRHSPEQQERIETGKRPSTAFAWRSQPTTTWTIGTRERSHVS